MDRASLEHAWRTREEATASEGSDVAAIDPLLPPLHRLLDDHAAAPLQGSGLVIAPGFNKDHITIIAHLDRSNPLTEARWVKTGDVDGWITTLSIDAKSDVVSEWKSKITVADPDPVSFFAGFAARLPASETLP